MGTEGFLNDGEVKSGVEANILKKSYKLFPQKNTLYTKNKNIRNIKLFHIKINLLYMDDINHEFGRLNVIEHT